MHVDFPHDIAKSQFLLQALTAVTLGEGLTETVSFVGYCKVPVNFKTDADFDPYPHY